MRWFALFGSLALTACVAPSPTDDDTGEVVPGELDGACPLNERVGLFSIVHEANYSAIDGDIHDAILPTSIVEEKLAAGGCQLLEPTNPFCDPACSSGEACDPSGICIPYPARLETGAVTLAGLEIGVVMNPRADKRYFETALPHPVFSPGTAIALTSSGGEIGPLDLSGRGFAPLELIESTWTIVPGQPLIVNWVPDEGGETRFQLTINIDQHGTLPVTVVCEGPDSGTFEVPIEILDALLEAGVSGFPVGQAYRRTVDSAIADSGCVEFQVRSHVSVALEVMGYVPCLDDQDCAEGFSCDLVNQICV